MDKEKDLKPENNADGIDEKEVLTNDTDEINTPADENDNSVSDNMQDSADDADDNAADDAADDAADSADDSASFEDMLAKNRDTITAALDKSSSYDDKQLEDELQKLTATFRDELKKAEQAANDPENAGMLIQQLDEPSAKIPEEDLCQCCGERLRDKSVSENYEYCAHCREAMKHYPLGIQHIAMLVVIIVAAVFSIVSFAEDYNGYNYFRVAKNVQAEARLTTALTNYDSAASAFEDKKVVGKKIYFNSAYVVYKTMPDGASSMNNVAERIGKALTTFEAGIPLYNNYVELRDKALTMYQTLQAFYTIAQKDEYSTFDGTDEDTYNAIMDEISALSGKTSTITKFSDTGETLTVVYDEAVIDFAKYMFSYSFSKYDDAYSSLIDAQKNAPSYIWMYAYELGLIDIQKGKIDEAKEMAEKLKSNNVESNYPYIVNAFVYRMEGDYEKSIEECDTGLKYTPDSPDLYRHKAIAYIVQGDFKSAVALIKQGLSYDQYGIMYFTYLVAATELKDEELVKEINSTLEEQNIKYSDRLQQYIDGKLTYKQLFTEGTGDVE